MGIISKEDIENIQVSSVMRNDKSFGKQNIFDGKEDTCWSSNEGMHQSVQIEFKKQHTVSSFSIQFQGGFVGKNCKAVFSEGEESTLMSFYPKDINSVQNFTLQKPVLTKVVKFLFDGSTDFFGRVVIYSIDFQ